MSSENDKCDTDTKGDMETGPKSVSPKVPYKDQESEMQKLKNLLALEVRKLKNFTSGVAEDSNLNKEKYIQNCIKWMAACCNVDEYSDCSLALNNLKILIELSTQYKELNGPVSHFLKTKFFTKFFKNFISVKEGWECIELSLINYKAACNAYHDRLQQVATGEFEKKIAPKSVVKVYTLLPLIAESGNDDVTLTRKWKIQFEDIADKCNSILLDLFQDTLDLQRFCDSSVNKAYSSTETPHEHLKYMLFYNYCNVLRFMLLCSFPAPKSIMPHKVFDIICQCVNVSHNTLGGFDTTQKMKLAKHLPQLKIVATSLLKALVLTCKSQLLPYSFLISKLLHQTNQSTDVIYLSEEFNHLGFLLHISAYDTWVKWAVLSNGAGAAQSANIAFSALNIVTVPSSEIIEETSIDNTGEDRCKSQNSDSSHPLQKTLSILALNVLQVYVREMGATLKVDELKVIQKYVVESILRIQRCPLSQFPYTSSKYRCELYSLLLELVNCQSSACGSPLNWAVVLFKQGMFDSDTEVVNFCSSAVVNVQNIVDQQIMRICSTEGTLMQMD